MAFNTALTVGQPAAAASGAIVNSRGGAQADTIVTELHGRFYESSVRGNRFAAANQAAVALTAAFATTYTGLVLYNPVGTSVNGVLEKVGLAQTVVSSAATTIGLMTGYSTTAFSGVTSITPKSKKLGGAAGQLLAAGAATLPIAPSLDTILGSLGTLATTGYAITTEIFDLGGDIVIPPGGFVAIYSTAAFTAALIASFQWEEVPITT